MPRTRRALSVSLFLLFVSVLVVSCDSGNSPPSGSADGADATDATQSVDAVDAGHDLGHDHDLDHGQGQGQGNVLAADTKGANKRSARPPGERPLPSFKGRTLSGTRFSSSSLIGKRSLLFFFNPEDENAVPVARAVVKISKLAQSHNFQVLGIGVGSYSSKVRRFAEAQGLEFPIIDDSDANITTVMRLPARLVLIGSDPEGYLVFFRPYEVTTSEGSQQRIEDELRASMRLPAAETSVSGTLIDHPVAPTFVTPDVNGKEFDFASVAGKPVVLVFFLHTCPHCHHALEFFETALAKIEADKRPQLVAISLQDHPTAIRTSLAELGLDYFTSLVDPGGKIATEYGLKGSVPDISLIDAEGRITYRIQGWRDDRDPPLMRMYLSKIAGSKIPMLLSRKGFTGNDACVACHSIEGVTWQYTKHASAFDTLVTHGEDRNEECVGCHVVGFEEPGGYDMAAPQDFMEDVGCESCHGRGGPHLSPGFVKEKDYSTACATCHDKKHSLGFDYETFRPLISHSAIAALSAEERKERFAGGHERPLLPSNADYVGSDACQSCHESEFATWQKSGHAAALGSLETKSKEGEAECLACHTTGYGLTGGYTTPAPPVAERATDLGRVGCESCHGPGSDHVAEGAKPFDTILSLGDKCDSCVILKICGDCHDAANDADFEFNVEDHIERQRHGTTEPGTSKPLGTSAAAGLEGTRHEGMTHSGSGLPIASGLGALRPDPLPADQSEFHAPISSSIHTSIHTPIHTPNS